TRGASGIVALVEFAPCGARRQGVPHPLGVAFAAPHRLAATCQPAANGSRSGGGAVLRQSRSALRRSQLGHGHGQAIGAGMDDSASRKTEETIARIATVTCIIQIWWLSPFGTLADLLDLIGFVACVSSGGQMRGPGPAHHSSAPRGAASLQICDYISTGASHAGRPVTDRNCKPRLGD